MSRRIDGESAVTNADRGVGRSVVDAMRAEYAKHSAVLSAHGRDDVPAGAPSATSAGCAWV